MLLFKLLVSYFLLFSIGIEGASYLDNEAKYREYDSSYSNSAFKIRKVEPLIGRKDFIVGLDCSMVSRIEECGGKYYGFDGREKEFFSLIRENGINTVRARLWYDYNSKSGVKGGGNLDKWRVLGMALRAKRAGLKFLLDFHYSDNWADPGKQSCPSAWEGLSFWQASDTLYKYTKETMEYFVSNGARIDYVQIGNEINNGFMYPYGQIDWSNDDLKLRSLDNVANLLNIAIKAVKEVSSPTKIIIHIGDDALKTWKDNNGKDVPNGLWFFEQLNARKVNYDIASVSFYLFNHHKYDDYIDMNLVTNCIDQFTGVLGKPFIIMEYSSAFTLKTHPFAENSFGSEQSQLVGKEYPTSFQGQTNFILDIAEKVAKAKGSKGIGFFYWGGEWIPAKGAGWGDSTTKSSWANQALFTYDGLASPALAAMKSLLS